MDHSFRQSIIEDFVKFVDLNNPTEGEMVRLLLHIKEFDVKNKVDQWMVDYLSESYFVFKKICLTDVQKNLSLYEDMLASTIWQLVEIGAITL
jgi:hypothetical protein